MCCLHGEPRLSDLLRDPILRLLLDRDGVSFEDIQRLIEWARRSRAAREEASEPIR